MLTREVTSLIFCSLGVFCSYLLYGIFQEKITRTRYGLEKEPFTYFFSMLFFQCLVNASFAFTALKFTSRTANQFSEYKYALCGFTYIGAMFSSNLSLKYVAYPVQVIGKSIKPIPVMLLSVILAKRKYPIQKYLFVFMISAGVALFMYKDYSSSKYNSTGFGECLLLLSLLFDGITGGLQETMRKLNVGPYMLMLKMNLWSLLYILAAILITREGFSFFDFAQRYPFILPDMLAFGLTSAVGQIFLFSLVTNFSPLTCAIVTTTRKFFTVLASVILFGHIMTNRQWLGTILVFVGLFLDQIFGKTKHPKKISTNIDTVTNEKFSTESNKFKAKVN